MKCIGHILMLLASVACSGIVGAQTTPREFQPMYGGLTPVAARAQLTEADRAVLSSTAGLDATRSSESWVKAGMKYFHEEKYDQAVHAFNLAWLAVPSNPNARAGWGIVVGNRDTPCKGAELIDEGTALGPIDASLAIDALGVLGSCALQAENREERRAVAHHCDAVRTILGAPKSEPSPRTEAYFSVAIIALAACGNNDEAWREVKSMRDALGREPSPDLMAQLRQLAPEPSH